MRTILDYLAKRIHRMPRWSVPTLAVLFNAGVAATNHYLGQELTLDVFYYFPIVLAAWFGGRRYGTMVAILSGIMWFFGEDVIDRRAADGVPVLYFWNFVIKVMTPLLVSWLTSLLQQSAEREKRLASTDPLTGTANRRVLAELVDYEMRAMPREGRPLSLAFIDLDNFKKVNDSLGHEAGDRILKCVVQAMLAAVRAEDTVARIGGDEFVVLIPKADAREAGEVMERVRASVEQSLKGTEYPVTISGGLVTCADCHKTTDELLARADAMMYKAKTGGKGIVIQE